MTNTEQTADAATGGGGVSSEALLQQIITEADAINWTAPTDAYQHGFNKGFYAAASRVRHALTLPAPSAPSVDAPVDVTLYTDLLACSTNSGYSDMARSLFRAAAGEIARLSVSRAPSVDAKLADALDDWAKGREHGMTVADGIPRVHKLRTSWLRRAAAALRGGTT